MDLANRYHCFRETWSSLLGMRHYVSPKHWFVPTSPHSVPIRPFFWHIYVSVICFSLRGGQCWLSHNSTCLSQSFCLRACLWKEISKMCHFFTCAILSARIWFIFIFIDLFHYKCHKYRILLMCKQNLLYKLHFVCTSLRHLL